MCIQPVCQPAVNSVMRLTTNVSPLPKQPSQGPLEPLNVSAHIFLGVPPCPPSFHLHMHTLTYYICMYVCAVVVRIWCGYFVSLKT